MRTRKILSISLSVAAVVASLAVLFGGTSRDPQSDDTTATAGAPATDTTLAPTRPRPSPRRAAPDRVRGSAELDAPDLAAEFFDLLAERGAQAAIDRFAGLELAQVDDVVDDPGEPIVEAEVLCPDPERDRALRGLCTGPDGAELIEQQVLSVGDPRLTPDSEQYEENRAANDGAAGFRCVFERPEGVEGPVRASVLCIRSGEEG